MPTVTGFTKDKMDSVDAAIIDSATVVNEDLIFTRRDSTQINAGNVRGIKGIDGPPGAVTSTDVDAAIAANQPGAWTNFVPATNWYGYYQTVTAEPRWRLETPETVRVEGFVQWAGGTISLTTVQVINALPVAARPLYPQTILGHSLWGEPAHFTVTTGGIINLTLTSTRTLLNGDVLSFGNLIYDLT